MNSFPVASLESGSYFSDNVFLDETFQLLDVSIPFSASVKKALSDWDFKDVYSDGSPKALSSRGFFVQPPEEKKEEAKKEEKNEDNVQKKETSQNISYESVDINDLLGLPQQQNPKFIVPEAPPVPDVPEIAKRISFNLESTDDSSVTSIEPQETKISEERSRKELSEADTQHAEKAKETYDSYLDYVNEVYIRYATHKELNYKQISDKMKELVIFIRDNQRFVLRVIPSERERQKNFLVSHSLRSTVLAISIGTALQLPPPKLIGLGTACLLHEIGQIRLPPQLYMTDRLLTAPEKAQMTKHPIIGYNILKEHEFPLAIQLGVLDHHERENGTGYPRHIKGEKITSFAKIISVACSFEAITAPRMFREERSSYEAMLELLKNHDKAYDETVIKALLKCMSLFPIGVYVQLADGTVAQVVDVTPGQPKNPKVKPINVDDSKDVPLMVQTDSSEHKIVRVLNKKEVTKLKQAD